MFSGALPESGVITAIKSIHYQLKPFKYSSHYWVLDMASRARRPLRILDVGTAEGYLGALLKEQGHFVVGIEQDHALAAQARQNYDLFHVADIESFDLPYQSDFDLVIFADVLEHLREPATVLRRSISMLNKTGEIIISVPNVANVFVRACLLFGRFEYSDRGILDRTHLRFFTLATLRKLMAQCGCQCLEVAPTLVPIQLVLPMLGRQVFAPLHEMHYLAVRSWKTLFAYQFVARAQAGLRESMPVACREDLSYARSVGSIL
jgi:2-polyprenyl-3-methyl-5-hydroxy-6-metoxy-1,4-benzoquinol methylase